MGGGEGGRGGAREGIIDSMFVYHVVYFDLRVETFHANV